MFLNSRIFSSTLSFPRLLFALREGTIDKRELKIAMKTLGFDGSKEEVKKLIADYDRNGKGAIDFNEFYAMLTQPAIVAHQAAPAFAIPDPHKASPQEIEESLRRIGTVRLGAYELRMVDGHWKLSTIFIIVFYFLIPCPLLFSRSRAHSVLLAILVSLLSSLLLRQQLRPSCKPTPTSRRASRRPLSHRRSSSFAIASSWHCARK